MSKIVQEAEAVAKKLVQLEAIREVSGAWGVSDKDKCVAIRVILTGKAESIKVVEAVTEIANSLGALL